MAPSTRDMKVTVCQMDPRQGHFDSCLEALTRHVQAENSDLVLLPEMCFSPWLAADRQPDPARWLAAVHSHARHIARLDELGTDAVLGTRPTVNETGGRHNEAYLWTRATSAATPVHEKYYLPDEEGYWEHSWYDRGPGTFETARAGNARIGVQICTEMWFFEWARHYAAAKVDLLCIPRATPHGSTDKWMAGGQAAAVCSGAYCLSSNLWCPPGDRTNCGGLGWVIDPEGEILATTDEANPFATVTVDLDYARESKETYPRYVRE